jgi:hypothetical protein
MLLFCTAMLPVRMAQSGLLVLQWMKATLLIALSNS